MATETPTTEPTEQSTAPETQPSQNSPKGYGKRPVWQWVVIYLIVAIVLYGLAYLIFFHKTGTGTTSGY